MNAVVVEIFKRRLAISRSQHSLKKQPPINAIRFLFEADVEMSACTGSGKMPAPVPVPVDTGQPGRHGSMSRPGQAGPRKFTGTGGRHVLKFIAPVDG